jgi:hypothetical protein
MVRCTAAGSRFSRPAVVEDGIEATEDELSQGWQRPERLEGATPIGDRRKGAGSRRRLARATMG